MAPEERRREIVHLVRAHQKVSVDWLAETMAASPETIRRDLADLDRRGFLRRVHGGAVIAEPETAAHAVEGPFAARMALNVRAKRAIAKAAIGLFSPGDSLFVDTGSTTLIFAEELAAVPGLTIITNSAAIAALAAKGEGAKVFQVGGEFRRGGQECVGELAIQQIGLFRAAHAVLGVAAVAETGFLDHDLQEAQIARAMARQAAHVMILADASKMERSGVFEVGALDMAGHLVTDAVSGVLAAKLGAAGVSIVRAT